MPALLTGMAPVICELWPIPFTAWQATWDTSTLPLSSARVQVLNDCVPGHVTALSCIFTCHAVFSPSKKVNEMLGRKGLALARPLVGSEVAW